MQSLETCGAEVQQGNAPAERKLQRLFRNDEACRMIKRCNDFGAGGVSVAVGELADGLDIDLNAVPKKYDGLDGTELAISESQERMAVVIEKENVERFMELALSENLEATVVAHVTEEPRLRMHWNGKTIVDISREFLNSNGAEKHINIAPAAPKAYAKDRVESFEDGYRYVGAPHAKLINDNEDISTLADYIAFLKENTGYDKTVRVTVDGVEYAIYYVECKAGDTIKAPKDLANTTISGTNEGGVIVTVKLTK